MDAITMLKDDHKTIEKLFKRFEDTGDRAHVQRRDLVARMVEELSKHAAIEEQLFYPVTRETVPDLSGDAAQHLEEHRVAEWLLDDLDGMDPTDPVFEPKVTVLIDNVRAHIREEEGEYFPAVREHLGRNTLTELGDAMATVKEVAPTHPHPRAPKSPTGNFLASVPAGAIDRLSDVVRGAARGALDAGADLAARLRGRERPRRPRPAGSPTTQDVAERVRTIVAEATDRAERSGRATVDAAATGAKATAKTARGGVTDTVDAAVTGAKNAKSKAKESATRTKQAARTSA